MSLSTAFNKTNIQVLAVDSFRKRLVICFFGTPSELWIRRKERRSFVLKPDELVHALGLFNILT
jgi:hypothetical protein